MRGPLQVEVRVGEKKTNCPFLVPPVLPGPTEPRPPCACYWIVPRDCVPPPTHPAIWTQEHVKKKEPTPRLRPPQNQFQQQLHPKLLQLKEQPQLEQQPLHFMTAMPSVLEPILTTVAGTLTAQVC